MNMLLTVILAVQMLAALGMIGLILIQHGKGADMGAAFGSGGSGSLFGASGSANFLSRTTAVLAGRVLRLHAGAGLLRQPAPGRVGQRARRARRRRRHAPAASGPAAQIPGHTAPPRRCRLPLPRRAAPASGAGADPDQVSTSNQRPLSRRSGVFRGKLLGCPESQ